MAQTKPRKSLWDASKRAAYEDQHKQAHDALVDQREGRNLAETLDQQWLLLTEEEAAFVEFLVLTERRIVMTLDADPLINGLEERGFLKPPPGVGALFQRYNQTTYSVPIALWNALNTPDGRRLFSGNNNEDARHAELKERFADRVGAMMHNETGFVDLPPL